MLVEQRESRLDIAVVRRIDQRLLARPVGPSHVPLAAILACRLRPRLPHGRAAPGPRLGRRRSQQRGVDFAVDAGQVVRARLVRMMLRRLVAVCASEGLQLGSSACLGALLRHGLLLPGRPGALVVVVVVSSQMPTLRVPQVLGLAPLRDRSAPLLGGSRALLRSRA